MLTITDDHRQILAATWPTIKNRLRLTPSGHRWEVILPNGRWVRAQADQEPAQILADGTEEAIGYDDERLNTLVDELQTALMTRNGAYVVMGALAKIIMTQEVDTST